jgi:flagellar protein FlaI
MTVGARHASQPTFDAPRGRPYAQAVAETSPGRGRWAIRHVPPTPRSIVELIRAGTLDAELAATLWLLIEGRVPLIVGALPRLAGKTTLLDALLMFLPPGTRTVELEGAMETFDWLPQAPELGWRATHTPAAIAARVTGRKPATVRPDDTVLLIPELSDHLPSYTWGAEARIAIRAAVIGYGLAATIHADSLDDVFDQLRRPPVSLGDDELSRLGIVLILRPVGDGLRRVVAAHYIRPIARDEHGHVQRLGPGVLATWDPDQDRFEHFGWGITPELALRVGRRPGDFEAEVERRRDYLAGLVDAGITDIDAVRAAIDGYRATSPDPSSVPATN